MTRQPPPCCRSYWPHGFRVAWVVFYGPGATLDTSWMRPREMGVGRSRSIPRKVRPIGAHFRALPWQTERGLQACKRLAILCLERKKEACGVWLKSRWIVILTYSMITEMV